MRAGPPCGGARWLCGTDEPQTPDPTGRTLADPHKHWQLNARRHEGSVDKWEEPQLGQSGCIGERTRGLFRTSSPGWLKRGINPSNAAAAAGPAGP